jgi:hypothetical protein
MSPIKSLYADGTKQGSAIQRTKGAILNQFLTEVVSQGAEALLPQNLPDTWVALLREESEAFS